MTGSIVSLAASRKSHSRKSSAEPKIVDCDSVDDFLSELATWTEGWSAVWYRGISADHANVPKLFRLTDVHPECGVPYSNIDESRIMGGISRKLSFFSDKPTTIPDTICLAQHLGFPTRLLDFSENLGTAIYFATPHPKCRPHIWVLEPIVLNALASMQRMAAFDESDLAALTIERVLEHLETESIGIYGNDEPFIRTFFENVVDDDREEIEKFGKFPVSFFPGYAHRRFLLQQTAFLLFGSERQSLERILSSLPQELLNKILVGFRFTAECELSDLREICPSPTQIFGDEQGLFQELIDDEVWSLG